MIKKAYLSDVKKYIGSGFNDVEQEGNIIKTVFDKRILEIFDTEEEADKYIRDMEK